MKQTHTPSEVRSRVYKSYFVEISTRLGLSHRDYASMGQDDIQEGLVLPHPEVDREKLVQVLEELYYFRAGRGEAGGVVSLFYRRAEIGLRVDYLLNKTVVGLL